MNERSKIAMEGHGARPSTPKPMPRISESRGAGQKPATPKPTPQPTAKPNTSGNGPKP